MPVTLVRRARTAVTYVAAALLTALTMTALPASPVAVGAPATADDVVDHVVAVSVDGLSPKALVQLGRARTPAFHRLLAHGAGTLNARTLRESTTTLPNHTGMLTGRRVRAALGGHGVTVDHDPGGTVHDLAGEYAASVFSVVHDGGGATALYAGKDKFALFDRTWGPLFGAPDLVGVDDGPDKIDRYVFTENTGALVTRLRRQLRNDPPAFAFLHLRLPDFAGHAHGYLRPPYLRAVRRTDLLLGRLLDTIAGTPSLRRHTALILTADHGGHLGGFSHSNPRRLEHYRIPFMVWGASVARGADLYALNPARARPGTRRTTYSGAQPIRNADLADLATDLLDEPAVPGSQLNRTQNLNVHPH